MIKALLLDLRGTLIAEGAVLPGVPEALRAFQTLQRADGQALISCLVSDYTMPMPRTAQAVDTAFQEYLAILEQVQLRQFFEPVEERVTLSTHAGVVKPDRRIFELALTRAKVNASLGETLFITEAAEHVKACREMGMSALQFGLDFKEWSAAPLLVAHTIGALTASNLTTTLKPLLAAEHQLQLEHAEPISGNMVRGRARSWTKLDSPELGALNGVYVQLPVDVKATVAPTGQLSDVRVMPHADAVAEAIQNVQTLVSNQQVSGSSMGTPDSPVLPTHSIETDAEGRHFLRRKRFSAW